MDRSRVLSWILGAGLLSAIASPFVYGFLTFFFFPGANPFMMFGVALALPFAFLALFFSPSAIDKPKQSAELPVSHQRIVLPLFILGTTYVALLFLSLLSPPFAWWGSALVSYFFTAYLSPLHYVIPNSPNPPWPLLAIPLYLFLPDFLIYFLLFRWRARGFAYALGLLTAMGFLALVVTFLLLSAFLSCASSC